MIVYRKAAQLRVRRSAAPEPPWWAATAIAPYGGRRAAPVAIDYLDLRATAGDRLDVSVAENPRDALERSQSRVEPPVVVDCAESAESVFRRGEATLELLREWRLPTIAITSPRGEIPAADADVVAMAAWPLDLERIAEHAAALRGRPWGLAVPVIFPTTTDLAHLERLRDIAAAQSAAFFAALPIEVDATAKQALAQSLAMPDDEETFHALFHSDLEPVNVATERHIAALAAEKGMADFVTPPAWSDRSNWNAATLLTLTAARMLAMESDIELAGAIARSARLVAALDKPLSRIAEAASLAIVEGLDEASADIVGEWLEGKEPAFVRRVNESWRLRRDAGVTSDE